MIEFLKGWGSLMIGSLALIQPWLISLWKILFRRGSIDIYETGSIEIGYSSFGPTIGLHGTLRAMHRDQFVRSAELIVTKQRDSSRYGFNWCVFRSEKLSIGGNQEMTLELPSGFLLSVTQPHRYNILFNDSLRQNEMRPQIQALQEAWTRTILDNGGRQLLDQGINIADVNAQIQPALNTLYNQFSQAEIHVRSFSVMDRFCYWEAGQYLLDLRVMTARPERVFSRKWMFQISQTESESIRLNSLKILQDTCGRYNLGQYNFAYVPYQLGSQP